jgi:hypothetical protein
MNETQLVRLCINYLLIHGHYVWRNNSGVTKSAYTDKFGRKSTRMWRSGMKGASDIIGVSNTGQFLAVECKIKPNKATESQQAFLLEVARRGGISIIAYDIDDLEAHGL